MKSNGAGNYSADYLGLLSGVAIAVALALPWMGNGQLTVTGVKILAQDPFVVEIFPSPIFASALFLLPVAAILAAASGVYGLVTPNARRPASVLASGAGLVGLLYYAIFVFQNGFGAEGLSERVGFWVALVAVIILIAQLVVPRPIKSLQVDKKVRDGGKVGLNYSVLAAFVIFAALPFYWMLIAAFKSDPEFIKAQINNPFLYSQPPTLKNFELLFYQTQYPNFVKNSLIVGIAVVVVTVVLAVPAAYSLARLVGRWGERLGIMIFMVYLVPPTLLFIPMTRMVTLLGLRDSVWSLIVVYPTFTVPFCTWLLMGFMKSIPADVEEQAMVDGYSRLGAVFRVVFPLALPGILTIIVFAFTLTMNEYIYALAFISDSKSKVIGPGVTTELIRGDVIFWQAIMAAGILVAVPVALVYNFFLDRFIAGFTLGAVKG